MTKRFSWSMFRDSGSMSSLARKPKRIENRVLPTYRKYPREAALELVRDIVLKARRDGSTHVFAEHIARELETTKGIVTTALAELNREGLVGQKQRAFAHDTSRDPLFGFAGCSGWAGNKYPIRPAKQ